MSCQQGLAHEYEQLRQAQFDPARRSTAPGQWQALVGKYRRALQNHADLETSRGLARALWRWSMALNAAGNAVGAVEAGRQAASEFDSVFRKTLDWDADERSPVVDEALAELLVARTDLAEMLAGAGALDERIRVLEDAREAGHSLEGGPRTRRALGTVHHNLSNAETARLLDAVRRGQGGIDPTVPTLSASRAVEIRQGLIDPRDPLTLWELANSYIQYLRCLGMVEELDRAVMVVNLAAKLIATMPAGTPADLRPQLDITVDMLRTAYPGHARQLAKAYQAGAAGRRPSRFGFRRPHRRPPYG
ncbi:hypothetical protein ABZ951_06630 [Streptomyces sp. NPDC046215]|uniref:Uncharacterized protein n=1 Tax=Streptomyces stramineus TaxID=173861 RepID=A0ABP3J5G9_9ACTN